MVNNAAINLAKAGIASGFGFLDRTAGFGVNFAPFMDYTETSTYGDVYWLGLQNTLVAGCDRCVLRHHSRVSWSVLRAFPPTG